MEALIESGGETCRRERKRTVRRFGTGILFGSFLVLGWSALDPAPLPAQEVERSVLDGVFTEEQANRGESTFRTFCSSCHSNSEFASPGFRERTSGRRVGGFFEYIRFNMPEDSPASLSAGAYANVVAYILYLNGFPPGDEELPPRASELNDIVFSTLEDEP